MQRVEWLDRAKALLMALVVLGHFHSFYAPVLGLGGIYAFHVPAFLVLSGFLLPSDFAQRTARQLWGQWLVVFIKAYAVFSALSILVLWGETYAGGGTGFSPLPALKGAFYGVQGAEFWFVHDNAPLWYFPFLTTSLALFWLVSKCPRPLTFVLTGLSLGATLMYTNVFHGPRLPWYLDISGFGAAMLLAGQVLRQHQDRLTALCQKQALALVLCAGGFVLLMGLAFLNGSVNLNRAQFGTWGTLAGVNALLGAAVVILLASQLPASRFLNRVGQNTLVIFCLHLYVIRLLAHYVLPRPDHVLVQQLIMVGATGVVLALCVFFAGLLHPVLRPVLAKGGA